MSPYSHSKSAPPFSLRLTPEDRARLERDAVGMSLGAYIRWRVFDPERPPPKRKGKAPVKDHQALARVIALLGQSHLASNVNQLAKAANTGSLPVSEETEAELRGAAQAIKDIRDLLIRAVGLSEADG